MALILAIALSMSACSDDGKSAAAGAGGSSGAAGADAQAQGGIGAGGTSTASGGTNSSSVGGATATTKLGQIQIASMSTDSRDRFIDVQFAVSAPANSCTNQAFGDCVISSNCSDPAATTVFASAGAVTVTSASPAIDVSLQPDANNEYTTQPVNMAFGGGEALHVSAVGATVPAFSADVTVPIVLLVDSPVADGSGVIAVPVTSDLTIGFSRGAANVKMMVVGSSNAGGLSCEVESTSGTITIPAAALAAIGSGVDLQLITAKLTSITDADWNIDVWTATPAYTADRTNGVTIHVR